MRTGSALQQILWQQPHKLHIQEHSGYVIIDLRYSTKILYNLVLKHESQSPDCHTIFIIS